MTKAELILALSALPDHTSLFIDSWPSESSIKPKQGGSYSLVTVTTDLEQDNGPVAYLTPHIMDFPDDEDLI